MNNVQIQSGREFALPGPEHFVKVLDGEYAADVVGVQGVLLAIGPRVVIWFRLDDGEYIAAYYKVKLVTKDGKPIRGRVRNPEFLAGWKSRIVRDLATLFPEKYLPTNLPKEVPRVSDRVIVATRTVRKDMSGNSRAESFSSSVVDAIRGWAQREDSDLPADTSPDLYMHNNTHLNRNPDPNPYTLHEGPDPTELEEYLMYLGEEN